MTTRRHTPEEIAETFVDIRTQEETAAERYARETNADLLDFVLNVAIVARDTIPTTGAPEPTAREVLELLLSGTSPEHLFMGTHQKIHWSMAFRELSFRIGEAASAKDAYRMTIYCIDIRPNTIPESMTEAEFRAAANAALQGLIAKPASAIQQDGVTE